MVTTTKRKSAGERREAVLDAALVEFAEHGLHGGSTEAIAAKAGISQPYVFRLFGTKKELFTAVINRCFRETLDVFQRAAEGKRGEEALEAMGQAYMELLNDRTRLWGQMQAYASCDDPEIRAGRPSRLRRPGHVRRTGRGPSARADQPLLRCGDAPERDRIDGAPEPGGAVGSSAARGLRQMNGLFISL